MNFDKIQKLGEYFTEQLADNRLSALKDLVNKIESGEFELVQIDPNQLYKLHQSVRHEYQRPLDIDWGGGMNSGEIGAGNEEAW